MYMYITSLLGTNTPVGLYRILPLYWGCDPAEVGCTVGEGPGTVCTVSGTVAACLSFALLSVVRRRTPVSVSQHSPCAPQLTAVSITKQSLEIKLNCYMYMAPLACHKSKSPNQAK